MGLIKLTKAMRNQLLEYLKDVEYYGFYWGPKQQFWKRHQKIVEWISEQKTSR